MVKRLSLFLSILVLVIGVNAIPSACLLPASPVAPQNEAEQPYLCITEEGYQQILKQGYDKGYQECWDRTSKNLCQFDLCLRKPTLAEVEKFLAEDDTNQMPGIKICGRRAAQLNDRAIERGMWSYVVMFNTSAAAHAVIAFDTWDEGLVFFEPQFDKQITVKAGYDYSLNFPSGVWQEKYIIREIFIFR